MTRKWMMILFFSAAVLSGATFLTIADLTLMPMVARGPSAAGTQVSTTGWFALAMSVLGTGGFTFAGIVAALVGHFGISGNNQTSTAMADEIVELTSSFAALMQDKGSRAAQRRFFFALVDAAKMINGCETSHDGGIVVIRYSGYADPVTPVQQGAKL